MDGKVFLPHIFEYNENSKKILEFILDNYNIDGIECYYTTFSKEQSDFLLNLCKEKNLLISGGSDYHDMAKPNVELGTGFGSLSVPEHILNNWIITTLNSKYSTLYNKNNYINDER